MIINFSLHTSSENSQTLKTVMNNQLNRLCGFYKRYFEHSNIFQGPIQNFSRGGGQNEGTQQIVMSFSPPVVGFLLKKMTCCTKGGQGHPRTP